MARRQAIHTPYHDRLPARCKLILRNCRSMVRRAQGQPQLVSEAPAGGPQVLRRGCVMHTTRQDDQSVSWK
jgi:hypothetical protein